MNKTHRCGYTVNRRGVPLFYQIALHSDTRPLVIFCNPLLEEALFCKNHLVAWAQDLAKRNYNVLMFDYQGSGNSGGEYPAPADQMLDDLIDIVNWCRKEYSIRQLCFIGIRFGFNIALKATKQLEVIKLIGIDPIPNPQDYQTTLLRTNLTTQLSTYGKVIADRKQLMTRLNAGERITLSGYEIDQEFLHSIGRFELQSTRHVKADEVLLLSRTGDKRKTFGKRVPKGLRKTGFIHEWIDMDPFWAETKYFNPAQSALFHRTADFLCR